MAVFLYSSSNYTLVPVFFYFILILKPNLIFLFFLFFSGKLEKHMRQRAFGIDTTMKRICCGMLIALVVKQTFNPISIKMRLKNNKF